MIYLSYNRYMNVVHCIVPDGIIQIQKLNSLRNIIQIECIKLYIYIYI